ncbi:Ig-like domain-containing protein [Nocardioides campestrisoli]|uniref:Ig-like domain-containing protein n=1 Tax=Nocardioides campestrisoli TaxID=2736757 RepID=UPI0015E65F7F|nr:Ig-like domain-containing protein [Nocardioides campestrisoli]
MKVPRILNAAGVVLLAGTVTVAFPGLSSAVFSATTKNTATVTAAADWTPPIVAVEAPGTWVRGTVQVNATARDERSSVARVALQTQATQPAQTGWTALCTRTVAPYACAWDTTKVADGSYAVRATAEDTAGYSATAVATTQVDNTPPTVALTAPAGTVSGTVTFTGTAGDAGSGLRTVVLQRAAAGAGAWTDVCTATTAPTTSAWSCTVDTRPLADGRYDLRAVATDRAGNTTTSAVVANRTLDNAPALAGLDVQSVNGGRAAERLDGGDTLVYTFTREVNLGSILAGWNGAERNVQVRVAGGFFGGDVLEVSGVNLGSLELRGNYVLTIFGRTLPATMTAETETVGGRTRTKVVVRFQEIPSGISTPTPSSPADMTWTPSGSVTDLLGNRSSTSTVTESGPLDKEF